MPEARQYYDLETLWSRGPEHDNERHYVKDEHVNLSAEELFWLESGWNEAVEETKSASEGTTNTEQKAEQSVHFSQEIK